MFELIKEFIKDFLTLGVFLTFLISLINILVTSRNLKRTKFIDTITTERIKWLEIIRNEASELLSELTEFLNYLQIEIEQIKDNDPSENRTSEINYEFQKNYLNAKNSNILPNNQLWSRTEFVKKLNLFKLRLNYKEDKEIILLIDKFINLVKSEYTSETQILEINNDLNTFIIRIQLILKNEWEKVKKETK